MPAMPAVPNGAGVVNGNAETGVVFLASFMAALGANGAVISETDYPEVDAVSGEVVEHQICMGCFTPVSVGGTLRLRS